MSLSLIVKRNTKRRERLKKIFLRGSIPLWLKCGFRVSKAICIYWFISLLSNHGPFFQPIESGYGVDEICSCQVYVLNLYESFHNPYLVWSLMIICPFPKVLIMIPYDMLCFAFVAALSIKSQINFKLFCCNLEGPPESSRYPYFQLHFFSLTCPSSSRSFPWFQAQFILLNYLTKVWIFLSMKYIEDFVCMWNFQESCWKNSNYFSRKPW